MQTKTKPYRIGLTTGGVAEVYSLSAETYPTLAEAEAAVERVNRNTRRAHCIISPDEVRPVIIRLRSKVLSEYLRGHGALIACDYDDARDRLLKLADVADKTWARTRVQAPRKGWLKTEAGLQVMFECLNLVAEMRRVAYGNLTPEELAEADTLRNDNPFTGARDAIRSRYMKEFEAKVVAGISASIHKDEY